MMNRSVYISRPSEIPLVKSGECASFEKLKDFRVDIEKIRTYLVQNIIGKYPPIMQGLFFGGWSVYSSNGRYDDGWIQVHKLFHEVNGKQVFDHQEAARMGKKSERSYSVPTEICTDYMAEIMAQIEALGLQPRRARVSLIVAKGTTSWHCDAEDKDYAVRLHIPLITNAECFFETHRERYSMPADGSGYLVRVNCEHRAFNHGSDPRYHIIMQVWDSKGLSQNQKFTGSEAERTKDNPNV